MAKIKITVYDLYTRQLLAGRDARVKELILDFIDKNEPAMLDGYVNHIITIGDKIRNTIEKEYNVTDAWKEVKNNPEVKISTEAGKPLRMGLIDSYIRTNDRIYILFLFLILFSARLRRYFITGIDPKRMQYALEYKINNNSDFKKYKSLIAIMNKKVDTYIGTYHKSIMKKTDREYRLAVVNAYNRCNDLVKNLAGQYPYSDEEFLMIQANVQDKDGKSLVAVSGIMEQIKTKAKDEIQHISGETLNSIGLPIAPENAVYIDFIKFGMQFRYDDMCFLIDNIMDEWRRRNPNGGTETFIKTFTQMSSARGMAAYHARIDKIFKAYKLSNRTVQINAFVAKKHMNQYIVNHIYKVALNIIYANRGGS